MSKEAENIEMARERVLVFLSFFISSESQRAFLPEVPAETLAYELCNIWFDRVFVAGKRYLDGIRGDWDEEEANVFRNAFDDEQWKYLERFHRFLELRVDMMPDLQKEKRQIPNNNLWESVVRDAGYLFELLEPDVKKRRAITQSLTKGLLNGDRSFLSLKKSGMPH